jgi:cytochrome P450
VADLSAAAQAPPHGRRPPVVGGLGGLGNAVALMRDPAAFFVDAYRRHGPVFRMRALGRGGIVLAGPEAAIFLNSRVGRDSLTSRPFWQGMVEEFGATEVVNGAEGERHHRLRGLMRDGFSRQAMRGRYADLVAGTDAALDRRCTVGGWTSVLELAQQIAAEQIGRLMIGSAPVAHVEDIRVAMLVVLNVLVARVRPRSQLRSRRYLEARRGVDALIDDIVRDFRARETGGCPLDSATAAVLRANRDTPELMPDSNVTLTLLGPFIAGIDSMANSLAACIYGILKHPEALRRVRDEADALFADDGIDEGGIRQAPAINGAMLEGMRLWPNAVAQVRTTTRDFAFAGYRIPAGERVYFGTTVPHYMAEFFPEPYRFDVDRYARPRAEHLQKGAYSPFGRGPHSCLGQGMAEGLMALGIARIFHRYDLALPSPDYVLKMRATPSPGPAPSFVASVRGERHPARRVTERMAAEAAA